MEKRKPQIRWERLILSLDGYKFKALNTVTFKYADGKEVTVTEGDRSDGATGVWDIISDAWGFHDRVCKTGTWDNGVKLCNWEASALLARLLWLEGRWIRDGVWFIGTFLLGGGEAKKNGMFRVKHER